MITSYGRTRTIAITARIIRYFTQHYNNDPDAYQNMSLIDYLKQPSIFDEHKYQLPYLVGGFDLDLEDVLQFNNIIDFYVWIHNIKSEQPSSPVPIKLCYNQSTADYSVWRAHDGLLAKCPS